MREREREKETASSNKITLWVNTNLYELKYSVPLADNAFYFFRVQGTSR
jgi:hypothetical protein